MRIEDRTSTDLALTANKPVAAKEDIDALQTKIWHEDDPRTRRFHTILSKLRDARRREKMTRGQAVSVSHQRIANWLGMPDQEQQFQSDDNFITEEMRERAIQAYQSRAKD